MLKKGRGEGVLKNLPKFEQAMVRRTAQRKHALKETTKPTVRDAGSLDEACSLLEVGFEYVTDMDDVKLFRRRKYQVYKKCKNPSKTRFY